MGNVWHQIGREDPYWGVLTEPQYHADKLTPAALDEFFDSGDRHVAKVLDTIRSIRPDFQPARALDFGCGVGRIVSAMSNRFATAGVDISAGMLAEAEKNVRQRGRIDHVTLSHEIAGTFDFTHSYITLQHMEVSEGLAVMREMVRRLNPGGVAMLHFPFYRHASRFVKAVHQLRHAVPILNPLINVYRGLPIGTPAMMGNSYSLNTVLLNARDDGGQFVHVEFEERGESRLALVYVFA